MKKSRSADDIEALRSAHSSRHQGDDGTKGNSSSSSSGNGTRAGRGRNDRDNNKERENSLPTIYPPPDYVQLDNNLHRARPPILEHNLPFLSHREIDVIMNLSGYPLEPALLSFCEQTEVVIYELTDLVSAPVDADGSVTTGAKQSTSQGNVKGSYGSNIIGSSGSNHSAIPIRNMSSNSSENILKNYDSSRTNYDDTSSSSVEVTVKTITADLDACKSWLIKTMDILLSLGEANILLIGESSCVLDAILVASLRKLQRWIFTSIICEFRFLTGKKMFDTEQFIESVDLSEVKISNPAPR